MKSKQIPVRKELPKRGDTAVVMIEGYKFKGGELCDAAELLRGILKSEAEYEISIRIRECDAEGDKI